MRDANITETTMFEAPARTSEEGVARALARIAEFSESWCVLFEASLWRRYGSIGVYGAFDSKTEALVGYCGLRHIDEFEGDIHISTMVDRPIWSVRPALYWSNGLASEIVRLNLEHAFLEQDFDVVYGMARTFQQASMRLMDKCGFIRQPDRSLRSWPVRYYALPKVAFLAQHVIYLKQRLMDKSQGSLQQPSAREPARSDATGRDLAGNGPAAVMITTAGS